MFGLVNQIAGNGAEEHELAVADLGIFQIREPSSPFSVDRMPYLVGSVYTVYAGSFGRHRNVLIKVARKDTITNGRTHDYIVQNDIDIMQTMAEEHAFLMFFHVQITATHVMLVVPRFSESLQEYVRTMGNRPTDKIVDVVKLVRKLWKALTYLHDQFIVHRDLRLKNVFLHRFDGGEISIILIRGILFLIFLLFKVAGKL